MFNVAVEYVETTGNVLLQHAEVYFYSMLSVVVKHVKRHKYDTLRYNVPVQDGSTTCRV